MDELRSRLVVCSVVRQQVRSARAGADVGVRVGFFFGKIFLPEKTGFFEKEWKKFKKKIKNGKKYYACQLS